MNGYFNRPELNEQRQAGGWHHTNDLGRVEADGSLTFIGPKTRLIKSAAENIYPTEVEGCLKSHPAVADAAVIGVPDRTWGQNVTAVVVLREGATAGAEEIIEHCRERIASYKKPKQRRVHRHAAPQRLRRRLRRARRHLRWRRLPGRRPLTAGRGGRCCLPHP